LVDSLVALVDTWLVFTKKSEKELGILFRFQLNIILAISYLNKSSILSMCSFA